MRLFVSRHPIARFFQSAFSGHFGIVHLVCSLPFVHIVLVLLLTTYIDTSMDAKNTWLLYLLVLVKR